MTWNYLSFANEDGFRGACIVQCEDIIDGTLQAHTLGIGNGQVLMLPVPDGDLPAPEWRNRALTSADVEAIWPGSLTVGEMNAEDDEC